MVAYWGRPRSRLLMPRLLRQLFEARGESTALEERCKSRQLTSDYGSCPCPQWPSPTSAGSRRTAINAIIVGGAGAVQAAEPTWVGTWVGGCSWTRPPARHRIEAGQAGATGRTEEGRAHWRDGRMRFRQARSVRGQDCSVIGPILGESGTGRYREIAQNVCVIVWIVRGRGVASSVE